MARVARAWGVTEDEVLSVMEPGDEALLKKAAAVKLNSDPPPREEAVGASGGSRDSSGTAFPVVNVPPRTRRPRKRKRQTVPRGAPSGHRYRSRVAWRLDQIVTNRDKLDRLTKWQRAVELDVKRAYDVNRNGSHHQSRRAGPASKPFEIRPEDCAPWTLGLVFDTRDPSHCILASVEDVERTRFDVEVIEAAIGDDFPDRELLFCLEFGCRLKSAFPFSVVVCPPHLSARPWMHELAKGVDEETEAKWLFRSQVLPFIPYHAAAFGVALKKHRWPPTPRRTTDMSYPEGRSVNEFIDLETDFPALKVLKMQEVMKAGAILKAGLRRVVAGTSDLTREQRAEMEDFLAPTAVAEDLKAFFNQFFVAAGDVHLQGMFFVDAEGVGSYRTSDVLQFGSCVGPSWGCRAANMIVVAFNRHMAAWEAEVARKAESGECPIALKLSPPSLREWIADRSATLGKDQAKCFWCGQYVDDFTSIQFGRLRALKATLTFWGIVESMGFPVADGKTQVGETITLLGLELYLKQGVVLVTSRKQRLYIEWLERVLRLEFIEMVEFQSLMGTLNFGIMTVPGARMRMARAYRLLHSKKPPDRRKGRRGRVLSDEVKQDFAVILSQFKNSTGVVLFEEVEQFVETTKRHSGATDACRELAFGSYSGMGGVCLKTGKYWWYDLSEEEKVLPIHITEFIAELIQLRLNAEELRGSSYLEWIDNAAVVSVLRSQGAKDQRMSELLMIRQALLSEYDIKVESRWLSSEDNKLADLISRNEVESFKKEAEASGVSLSQAIDVKQSGVIPDLAWVMERMIELTSLSIDD